jgi:hypothetical protein
LPRTRVVANCVVDAVDVKTRLRQVPLAAAVQWSRSGLDVLVDSEQVVRVVPSLHVHEARVVATIVGLDPILIIASGGASLEI